MTEKFSLTSRQLTLTMWWWYLIVKKKKKLKIIRMRVMWYCTFDTEPCNANQLTIRTWEFFFYLKKIIFIILMEKY